MKNVDKDIEKKLNLIVDRYLKLDVDFKEIKRYLTGKNIKVVIDELSDLEIMYLKRYEDKTDKDFKNLVKDRIINILKDRKYAKMDKNESMKHIKYFENNISDIDPFDEEDWEEEEYIPNTEYYYCVIDDDGIKNGTAMLYDTNGGKDLIDEENGYRVTFIGRNLQKLSLNGYLLLKRKYMNKKIGVFKNKDMVEIFIKKIM